ncbi:MAG TPA: MarR family transcriptional regulator [Acidimicrobiales bacterium]|nr:MarR family transcriptional regulator [Acidimicrobiales bacterium]
MPTATAPALASRLRLSATRLARTLRREAGTGLSPSQLSALSAIDSHGSMTLGALAVHERVAPPSITKVVAKLAQAGLVDRELDPNDRRVARVALTRAGHDLLDESRRRKDAWLSARLAQLDSDKRSRLAAALDVLDELTQT